MDFIKNSEIAIKNTKKFQKMAVFLGGVTLEIKGVIPYQGSAPESKISAAVARAMWRR